MFMLLVYLLVAFCNCELSLETWFILACFKFYLFDCDVTTLLDEFVL